MTRLSWLIAPVYLLGLSQAKPVDSHLITRGSKIEWKDCILNKTQIIPTQCGKLKVPLDYSDSGNKKEVTLELTRVEALKKPSKGTILMNFGGPGGPGRPEFASDMALTALGLTGGEHDLVTFDPRGTGDTLTFSCFSNDLERSLFTTGQYKPVAGAFPLARGQNWATSEIFAEQCAAAQNETGRFLGTSFVARDMMQIVDALNEDGMLRYWGMSYGTYLGAVAAAMFTDKVDKMMLDGVVNPFDWRINYDIESFVDVDKTLSKFCQECVEAQDDCALAGDLDAEELEKKLYEFFDDIRLDPVVVKGTILDYNTVKVILYNDLKTPRKWRTTAKLLYGIMERDVKIIEAVFAELGGGGEAMTKESQFGIRCSDMTGQTDDIHDIIPLLDKRWDASRFAADVVEHIVMRCSRWKLPAAERYEGDFKVKTKNPMLVIGNTLDCATPLESARNVTKTFEGARLLQFDIPGHTILGRSSECIIKATMDYWNEGKLPRVRVMVGLID
ncbi:hypothetical protein NCS55_01350100 [Fusarium keratoplasticum]|nr:hypothetical protein NCS55_01350100 [Fusarium keratoplasticum]